MTDSREIELEFMGRGCFVAALEVHPQASTMASASSVEKERVLLSVVEEAQTLLDSALEEEGAALTSDEMLWVKRGISLACEEWIRTPEERILLGVEA